MFWILSVGFILTSLHVVLLSTIKGDFRFESGGFVETVKLIKYREARDVDAYAATYLTPPAGPITGKVLQLSEDRTVFTYFGVPYAQPPIGELRFKRPVKLPPWEHVFNATGFGPLCVQSKSRYHLDVVNMKGNKRILRKVSLREYPQAEDCLNLNIYVPSEVFRTGKASVMVYFHGGSYKTNGGRFYPGEWLASKGGLVVITLNYRLGVFGFLSTNDEVSKGNYGLHDQRIALQWIKENIPSFGGDPNDVTIFGNSAGGACVGLHVLSPLSSGFFHKAIIQSGSPMGEWAVQKKPRQYTKQLASKLKCPDLKFSQHILDCLRNISVEKIIEKSEDAKTLDDSLMLQFAPVVDGEFLQQPSLTALLENSSITVPVLIGMTKDELEVWMIRSHHDKDPSSIPFTKDLLRKYLLHIIRKDSMSKVTVDVLLNIVYAEYTREQETISTTDAKKPSLPDIRTLGKIISDIDLKAPSVKFVELLSRYSHAPIFMYEFDYVSSDDIIVTRTWVGSYHESELYYIFGFPHMALDNVLRMNDDKRMSDLMIKLWSDFAKSGNPTPEDLTGNSENFTWDTYTTNDKSYAVLDLQPHVRRFYESERMIFWNHFVPMLTEYSLQSSTMNEDCRMGLVVLMYIIVYSVITLQLGTVTYLCCKKIKNAKMNSLPIPV